LRSLSCWRPCPQRQAPFIKSHLRRQLRRRSPRRTGSLRRCSSEGGRSWVRTSDPSLVSSGPLSRVGALLTAYVRGLAVLAWTRVCQSGAVATPVATRAVAQPTRDLQGVRRRAQAFQSSAPAPVGGQFTRTVRTTERTSRRSPSRTIGAPGRAARSPRSSRNSRTCARSRRGLAIRSRATDCAAGHHSRASCTTSQAHVRTNSQSASV